MRRPSLTYFVSLLLAVLSTTGCLAGGNREPNFQGIVGSLINGILQSGQIEAAKRSWASLSATDQYCFEMALGSQGYSITAMIQSGIAADDPRLGPMAAECHQFDGSVLRKNYSCQVPDEENQLVNTICDQSYARPDPNDQPLPIGIKEAIQLHYSGIQPILVDIETALGKQQRIATREAEAVAGEVASLNSERSDAMGQLETIKTQAEARSSENNPENFRERLSELQKEYQIVSSWTAPVAQSRIVPETSIGPSWDCSKISSIFGHIVCASEQLRRTEIEFVRPYYAIVFLFPNTVKVTDLELSFLSKIMLSRCLPKNSEDPTELYRQAEPCLAQLYRRQTRIWDSRIERSAIQPAIDEINRPIEDHLLLQRQLKDLGYLTAEALADGVYGATTRRAITAFQQAEGLQPDGLMSDATAERIRKRSASAQTSSLRDVLARIAALQTGYARYESDLDEYVRDHEARLAALERLADARVYIVRALDEPIDVDLHAKIGDLVNAIDAASDRTDLLELKGMLATSDGLRQTIASFEEQRIERATLLKHLAEAHTLAVTLIHQPIAPDLRVAIDDLIKRIDLTSEKADLQDLRNLVAATDKLNPRLEDANRVLSALTPRSHFIVEGPPNEILLLYNDTGKAPSIVKDLEGRLKFVNSSSIACYFHLPLTDIFTIRQIRERLNKEVGKVIFPLPQCEPNAVEGDDIIVLQRDAFVAQRSNLVLPLISAVNKGSFSLVSVITDSDFAAARTSEIEMINTIDARIGQASMEGFAYLALGNGATTVCRVIGVGEIEAHSASFDASRDRLSDELGGPPLPVQKTKGEAFISAKRKECGAVYARASDLQGLSAGFRRDNVPFHILPLWVPADQIEREKRTEADLAASRDRPVKDLRCLELSKSADSETARATEELDLRKKYGPMARAFAGILAAEANEFVENGKAGMFSAKYPLLVQIYNRYLADKWELVSLHTDLSDYGTAEFKQRPLEAGLGVTKIQMRNRVLGEYKELCFVTGFINDTEFEMQREPFGMECGASADRLAEYERNEGFSSHWVVQRAATPLPPTGCPLSVPGTSTQ